MSGYRNDRNRKWLAVDIPDDCRRREQPPSTASRVALIYDANWLMDGDTSLFSGAPDGVNVKELLEHIFIEEVFPTEVLHEIASFIKHEQKGQAASLARRRVNEAKEQGLNYREVELERSVTPLSPLGPLGADSRTDRLIVAFAQLLVTEKYAAVFVATHDGGIISDVLDLRRQCAFPIWAISRDEDRRHLAKCLLDLAQPILASKAQALVACKKSDAALANAFADQTMVSPNGVRPSDYSLRASETKAKPVTPQVASQQSTANSEAERIAAAIKARDARQWTVRMALLKLSIVPLLVLLVTLFQGLDWLGYYVGAIAFLIGGGWLLRAGINVVRSRLRRMGLVKALKEIWDRRG